MSKKDRLRRKEIEAYKEYKSARESGDGAQTQKAYDHLQKRQIKSIKGDVNVNYDEIGLMQTDPLTGMPVAQPGSTPMFPVSAGFVGGSTAKFNPRINQYAQADPLANAAYASQPMPALAQQKTLQSQSSTMEMYKQKGIEIPESGEYPRTGEYYGKGKVDYSNVSSDMVSEYEKNRKINKLNLLAGRGPNLDSAQLVDPDNTPNILKDYYTGKNWRSDIAKSKSEYDKLTEEQRREL